MTPFPKKDIPLTQLDLSVRASNACIANNLLTIEDLYKHYKASKNFKSLKNVGYKTNEELCDICKAYEINALKLEEKVITRTTKEVLPVFSKIQHNTLDLYIDDYLPKLTTRAANCLNKLLNNNVTFDKINTTFFKQNVNLADLQNIGSSTKSEIEVFFSFLRQKSLEINKCNKKHLQVLQLKLITFHIYKIPQQEYHKYNTIFEQKNIPFFKLIAILLENYVFFPKRDTFIFYHYFLFFEDRQKMTLKEIGGKLNLTTERIRQKTNVLKVSFEDKIKLLSKYKSLINFNRYKYKIENDCIYTSENYAKELNHIENINFKPAMFTKVIAGLFCDTHSLFKKKHFKHIYLIKKTYLDIFQWNVFFNSIQEQLEEKIDENIEYSLEGYILEYITIENKYSVIDALTKIVIEILENEFSFEELEINLDNELVFKRNTYIAIHEYAYQILDEHGSPLHLNDIYEKLKDKNATKSAESLRGSLNREACFTYFGRSSTYGLAKWDKIKNNTKSGTIRSITQEYLSQFAEPKHISEIVSYVLQHRPMSNSYSIKSNLAVDEKKRFVIFKGGFIGLTDKNYKNINFKDKPKFFFKYVKKAINNLQEPSYNAIANLLTQKYSLHKIQVTSLLDNRIADGKLRLENEILIVC